jgi:hypothetical protein
VVLVMLSMVSSAESGGGDDAEDAESGRDERCNGATGVADWDVRPKASFSRQRKQRVSS